MGLENLKLTAEYFGGIQLLGIAADGYVLSDGTPCLSERGAAKLLGFKDHAVLNNLVSNRGDRTIKSFIDRTLTRFQTVVVTADCRQRNSGIKVYTAQTVNGIAKAYATAYLAGKLRKNQSRIGLHCASLRNALADAALEQIIYDGCAYKPAETFPQRVERGYMDAVALLQESGFACSLPDGIATKKDIAKFLKVPEGTLTISFNK